MSKSNLSYVELKSGYNDDGPAWICIIEYSKSKQMVYFDGKALKRFGGDKCASHKDVETGECYWITGIKKRGTNRHWAGHGIIMIEENVIPEYLKITGKEKLLKSEFKTIKQLEKTEKRKFEKIFHRETER